MEAFLMIKLYLLQRNIQEENGNFTKIKGINIQKNRCKTLLFFIVKFRGQNEMFSKLRVKMKKYKKVGA